MENDQTNTNNHNKQQIIKKSEYLRERNATMENENQIQK